MRHYRHVVHPVATVFVDLGPVDSKRAKDDDDVVPGQCIDDTLIVDSDIVGKARTVELVTQQISRDAHFRKNNHLHAASGCSDGFFDNARTVAVGPSGHHIDLPQCVSKHGFVWLSVHDDFSYMIKRGD